MPLLASAQRQLAVDAVCDRAYFAAIRKNARSQTAPTVISYYFVALTLPINTAEPVDIEL